MQLSVHLLPSLVAANALRGSTAVVIDVLRATTTITHALHAGASSVVACLKVDDARQIQQNEPHVLLGGERGGQRIDGFDCGNSPLEYTPERVSGKVVAFTTTNGTRAMQHCQQSDTILLAAFVNLSAICQILGKLPVVDILCAGTDGEVTREDVLLAGAIVSRLTDSQVEVQLNDQARLAADAWTAVTGDPSEDWLQRAVVNSQGGRNLKRLGLGDDIACAARIDSLPVVTWVDPQTWRIRLFEGSRQEEVGNSAAEFHQRGGS